MSQNLATAKRPTVPSQQQHNVHLMTGWFGYEQQHKLCTVPGAFRLEQVIHWDMLPYAANGELLPDNEWGIRVELSTGSHVDIWDAEDVSAFMYRAEAQFETEPLP